MGVEKCNRRQHGIKHKFSFSQLQIQLNELRADVVAKLIIPILVGAAPILYTLRTIQNAWSWEVFKTLFPFSMRSRRLQNLVLKEIPNGLILIWYTPQAPYPYNPQGVRCHSQTPFTPRYHPEKR